MTWLYKEVTNDSVDEVINQVARFLNTLDTDLAVKFDVSNAQRSPARGIVFYNDGAAAGRSLAAAVPEAKEPNISWNQYTWHSETDYEMMYKGFANGLNTGELPNGQTISRKQAHNARAVFTNAHERDATLSIYYPSE
jgi:hypothetical protein